MKNQSENNNQPLIELEKNNNSSSNIYESIEKLKKTIETIKDEITSVDDSWWVFFIDRRIKDLKLLLTIQLDKILRSIETTEGYDYLELKGKIDAIYTTLSIYQYDPKFSKIANFIDDLNRHIVYLDRYTKTLKNDSELKIIGLKNQNLQLLSMIGKDTSAQNVINTLLNDKQKLNVENQHLTQKLHYKNEENNQLTSQLKKTSEERNNLQQENEQLKNKESAYDNQKPTTADNDSEKNIKLKNENIDLKNELEQKKLEANELNYKYRRTKGDYNVLKSEIYDLKRYSKKQTQRYSKSMDKLQQRIYELEHPNDFSTQNSKSHEHHHNPYRLFNYTNDSHHQSDNGLGIIPDMQRTLYNTY